MSASGPPTNYRGVYRDDVEARAVYSEAAGIGQAMPRAVARPVDANDVVTLVQWAAQTSMPLIPRGSGSSMAGGAIGDGLIVDLGALDDVERVDAERRVVRCGPGALRNTVDAAARVCGLTFPVDPSSGAYCTMGGMAAANSAGAHTLRYGATRAWIEALDCVFADGARGELRRGATPPDLPAMRRVLAIVDDLVLAERAEPSRHEGVRKESSGYGLDAFVRSGDVLDLIAGSEGTLALIVGLELRLAPRLPATASVLGAFSSLDDAVTAAGTALALGASACELLDRTFLDVARQGGTKMPVPDGTEAVLLAEVEGASVAICEGLAQSLARGFERAGATGVALALDASTEHAMWELRHAASPILSQLDPALKSMQFIEDGCVPPARLAEYVRGVRAALARQSIRGVIFGHAGDAHVHVNPLVDVRQTDWRARVDALLDEVTTLAAQLGGTIAGEHGDGRLRSPLLGRLWSPGTLQRFAAVKRAFDPANLLNPGVKVSAAGAPAVDRVKYDPTLAPLPPSARTALATVERDRAYARPRLELLAEASRRLDAPADDV